MKHFKKEDYKICIVGMGYVGLPLAARLSLKGFDLVGFDINSARVKELKNANDRNNDIDLELTNSVGISGLNSYYTLKKVETHPYARVEQVPKF